MFESLNHPHNCGVSTKNVWKKERKRVLKKKKKEKKEKKKRIPVLVDPFPRHSG